MSKPYLKREEIRFLKGKSIDLDWERPKHNQNLKILIHDLLFMPYSYLLPFLYTRTIDILDSSVVNSQPDHFSSYYFPKIFKKHLANKSEIT